MPLSFVDIYRLKNDIESKLRKGYVSSKVLLGRSRFIDESSKKSSAFTDPNFLPFYYHLGKLVESKSVVEIGVGIGLKTAAFVQGSPCNLVLGLQIPQKEEFYNTKFAKKNIKDHLSKHAMVEIDYGLINDPKFLYNLKATEWEVGIISEESTYENHIIFLNTIWDRLKLDGLIVVDYQNRHELSRKAFEDFAKIKNRDFVIIDTRYGVGILQK